MSRRLALFRTTSFLPFDATLDLRLFLRPGLGSDLHCFAVTARFLTAVLTYSRTLDEFKPA